MSMPSRNRQNLPGTCGRLHPERSSIRSEDEASGLHSLEARPPLASARRRTNPMRSIGSAVLHALQPGAKTEDGLGVNLANSRFGQIEDFGDFREAHFLKVVHRKDLLRN